jgi:hypothetical protein
MSRKLFVFGMFRSGTTLVARQIDAHDDITCASDPFRPFYNSFRDSIAAEIGVEHEPFDPLGDYFADEKQLELFDAVQGATFDREFDQDRDELLSRVKQRGRPFSPYISETLDTEHVSGDTFGEILDRFLDEVPAQYGSGEETWYGTKETWATEFVPLLRDRYPESKFLLVVRDPRAVCASKFAQETVYPWLFLTRQWRKLALLAHQYEQTNGWDDVHVIRYEDLVTEPEQTATEMCEFLGVDVDEDILNPATFTDGKGDQWLQNTSYDGEGEASFNTDSVDKWERTLTRPVVEYIERLCFSEMALFGYDHEYVTEPGFEDEELVSPPTLEFEEFADWIKPYYEDRTPVSLANEMGIENVRHRLLTLLEESLANVDRRLVRAHFFEPEILSDCREAIETDQR